MADIQLLLEAERRGILPADKKALLDEARNRGLVPKSETQQTTQPQDYQRKPATWGEVIGGLPARAIAGAADILPNFASNVVNLGKAAYGTGAILAGRPDLAPDVSLGFTPVTTAARQANVPGFLANKELTPAQRIVDVGGQGAVLAPIGGASNLLRNMIVGGTSAAAGQATTEATGSPIAGLVVGAATPFAISKTASAAQNAVRTAEQQQAANVVKDKIWQDARSAGFVAPKSAVSPTATTTALEGFAGKTATTEKAMVKNQETTNNLIRQEFGISKDTPLSSELFEKLRADAGRAYDDVQSLPLQQIDVLNPNTGLMQPKQFNPKQMVADLRQARSDARSNWTAFKKNGNPEFQQKANAAENEATRLENELDKVVSQSGQPELMANLRQARVEIAKLHQVENSFNPSSQNVDPAYFARLAQKGAPLTGNLKIIGDFANQFPRYVKETSKLASPGSSSVNSLGAAVLGAFGNLKTAGLMATRGPVGSMMLSGPYQNMFVKPNYGPNMLIRGAANLANTSITPNSVAAANVLANQLQGQQ